MNESKHTPGPWDVCLFNNDDTQLTTLFLRIGRRLFNLGHINWKNDEANARLIAAAPELLAIVQEIVASVDGGGELVTIGPDTLAEYRAAIDKATGDAS